MFRRSRCGAAAGAVLALAAIAGCTSTVATTPSPSVSTSATASPSPTPTPTPSPTWSAEQAAAIKAIDDFGAADLKIGADPSAFTKKQMTELLEPFGGGEAVTGTVNWYLLLKKHGYRFVGRMDVLSTVATDAVDEGRGTEVHVTRCQDQRSGKVVDKDGNPVTDDQFKLPVYNLRQYAVRRPTGENAFRVFGYQTINGECP